MDLNNLTFDIDALEAQSEFDGYIVRDTVRTGDKGPYWALLIYTPETDSYETKNINIVNPKDHKAWAGSAMREFLNVLKDLGVRASAPGSLTGQGFRWQYVSRSFTNRQKETVNYSTLVPTAYIGTLPAEECGRLAAAFDRKVAQSGNGGAKPASAAPVQMQVTTPTMPEGEDLAYIITFLSGKSPDEVALAAARDPWFKERPAYRTGLTMNTLTDAIIEAGHIGLADGVYVATAS